MEIVGVQIFDLRLRKDRQNHSWVRRQLVGALG